MIIEIRAKNCYAFEDDITFSMKADMRNKKFGANVHKENNFNVLKTVGIYGPSTITLWIPAFKTYSKINQYIYGCIEPRIYEKNLNKRQGEIDRLQNMLNSNGSNLL